MRQVTRLCFSVVFALCGHAGSQTFPDKPVKIIVPFAAGGGTDTSMRLIGQKLSEKWGKPVVVDNKAGAQGNIGARAVAGAKADGYTILGGSNTLLLNPAVNSNVGYQLKDFTPIVIVASSPYLLVAHPTVSANTLPEFIAWAKSKGGAVTWSSNAEGSPDYMTGILLQKRGNFKMVNIPFKGASEAVTAIVAGHVEAGVMSMASASAYIQAGKLKVLAVLDRKRVSQLPSVQTASEVGITGVEFPTWYAMWVPADTPTDIADKINRDVEGILKLEDVKERLQTIGFVPVGGTRAQFSDYQRQESENYLKIVETSGAKKQ